jgi:hypothetical protein
MKCNPMLNEMAPQRYRLVHKGNVNRLSFSDNEFIALNISISTNTDSDMVVAFFWNSPLIMSQPTKALLVAHSPKCVYTKKQTNKIPHP